MRKHLDLSAVEAFVIIADMKSFSRAADVLHISQAGISMKLRRLENVLGKELLVRTPRQVRLTSEGEIFLPQAKALLSAQETVLKAFEPMGRKLTLGISDHVAGPELPAILAKMRVYDPDLTIQTRVGSSSNIFTMFQDSKIDVAILRRLQNRSDDEVLFSDRYGWLASFETNFQNIPLPLITVDDACGVRTMATNALTKAGREWSDAYIGGSVGNILDAVASGIGVAPLPVRLASAGIVDVGPALGLPPLPMVEIAVISRPLETQTRHSMRSLTAVFRGHFNTYDPIAEMLVTSAVSEFH